MQRKLATAVLVIAILHLVGGGLGLLCSIGGCASLFMMESFSSVMPTPPTLPARPGQPAPPPLPPGPDVVIKQMNDTIPGYRAFTVGSLAYGFLLDVLLISSGIGLLKMQPWARWLSVVYAVLSILLHVGSFAYQLIWVMPVAERLYAQAAPATPGFGSMMKLSVGAGAFGQLIWIIYPIAVLIVLFLPSTSAAFRGEVPVRDDNLPDEEEDYHDQWREPPPRSDKFRQ